jgi:beta-lactamase class A
MKKILTTILLFVLTVSACSAQQTAPANRSANPTETGVKRSTELDQQIALFASEAKGRVGVMAEILETGESVSLRAAERFPMQSVYKLPIGMAALKQVDDGKLKLDQRVKVEKSDFANPGQYSPVRDKNPNGTEMTVEELVEWTVSESDTTTSDVLLRVIGIETVKRYLDGLGINNIVVADSEKEIGRDWETQYRNWASPEGAVALLRALQKTRAGLSVQSQALILRYLIETPRGAKRLKGLLPAGTVVAHKPGTSGSRHGVTAATNDIGLITLPDGRHLAIAVFVTDSPADEKTREEVIAKIARAAWDKWSR